MGVATGMVERFADQARQRIEEALTDLSANQAEGVWRQAERDLQEHYERLRESLRPMNVGWGHTVSGTTPEHPLGSHASFNLPAGYVFSDDGTLVTTVGNPDAPPVDVTVDFWHYGSQLRYTSEVSRRGSALREGPAGVIDCPSGVIGSYNAIKAAMAVIGQFIDASGPVIREHLSGLACGRGASKHMGCGSTSTGPCHSPTCRFFDLPRAACDFGSRLFSVVRAASGAHVPSMCPDRSPPLGQRRRPTA